MKKILLSAMAMASVGIAHSQTTLYSGDGTLASNRIVTQSGKNLTFQPTAGSLFINGTTGLVGINTLTPAEQLDVAGNIQAKQGIFTNSQATQTFSSYIDRNLKCNVFAAGTLLDAPSKSRALQFFDFPQSATYNPDGATIFFSLSDRANSTRLNFYATQALGSTFNLFDKTQAANFTITDNGSNNIQLVMPKANSFVGIGTSNFVDGTDIYQLAVNGNIRAKKIKVYTTWADFVFEDGYKLPTLTEVEKYIEKNGHLENIPSAAEVEKKGIELGEMNKLLLQKIEELMLYTIDIKKESEKQNEKIKALETQIELLSNKK